MVDIGDTPGTFAKFANSKAYRLFVRPSGADIEYLNVQDKSYTNSHPVTVEGTVNAGVVGYSGTLDSDLTGTILFTSDTAAAIGGFTELRTPVNNNIPIKTWKLKITDFTSTLQTWSVSAMLETFELSGPDQGGTKYNISLKCLTEPVIT